MSDLPTPVQRVVEDASARGLQIRVREYPEGTKTADEAARAVGCNVAQIVKTLVFMADGAAVVAMVSGRHRLDPAKLATVASAGEVRRATPQEAREATGFAIGGTPPFGHPRPLRIFMDHTLLEQQEVWCAAGTPSTVFSVEPGSLLKATGALVEDLHQVGAEEEEGRPSKTYPGRV